LVDQRNLASRFAAIVQPLMCAVMRLVVSKVRPRIGHLRHGNRALRAPVALRVAVSPAMEGARNVWRRSEEVRGLPRDEHPDVGLHRVALVHYVKPGGSSLLSREAYTFAQVSADALRRKDPERYAERVREKYIKGADEEMPAVISVNMTAAAMAVNEFLARRYRTRNLPNSAYATTRINLAENEIECVPEGEACPAMGKLLSQGDAAPLLGLPELSA
jgi:hypothetical protein